MRVLINTLTLCAERMKHLWVKLQTFIASYNFFAMTSRCNILIPVWLLRQVNRCVRGPRWLIWANTAQVKKFYIPLTHGNRYKRRQDKTWHFIFEPFCSKWKLNFISSVGGLLICSLKHERRHVGHVQLVNFFSNYFKCTLKLIPVSV